MNKKIYILEEITGEYEDIRSHNIEAYTSLEKAQKECKRLNDQMTEFKNRYDEIDDDTDELKNDIFKEHLKNINTELYNEVIEEWNRDEKEPSDFDWDKYYEERDKFCDDPEFKTLAKEYGFTEKQIEDIEVSNEMEEMCYDVPFYHVNDYPIDLIED